MQKPNEYPSIPGVVYVRYTLLYLNCVYVFVILMLYFICITIRVIHVLYNTLYYNHSVILHCKTEMFVIHEKYRDVYIEFVNCDGITAICDYYDFSATANNHY